jgi:hypothetical protein
MSINPKLPAHVQERAHHVAAKLREGVSWMAFGGKRLNSDRSWISVPLGRNYRLVARDTDKGIEPVEVMSHEAYNNWMRRK